MNARFEAAPRLWAAVSLWALGVGCGPGLDPRAQGQLSAMQMGPDALPASPTNRYADDARAAELGRSLFFDARMSSDGTVACASCHKAAEGFSDARQVSLGVRGQSGKRHAMTVAAAALHPFNLWDGKADSLWSQPLKAIENPLEMDFSRTEVAHLVAEQYRDRYEAVFGAVPDLSGVAPRAAPGSPEWDALSPEARDGIQRVFANVGKAIEAYERRLTCGDTRFDRWARGELDLTPAEAGGAESFVRDGCIRCHTGPSFSDGKFHNLGIGAGNGDTGRQAGLAALREDPFNGAGAYSDDAAAGRAKLAAAFAETGTAGAFRTASLRGAGQRTFFGHLGHRRELRDFIQDVYGRGRNGNAPGTDPLLRGVRPDNLDGLVAFLHTLDCPAPAPELQKP